jgi:hypothetical protein
MISYEKSLVELHPVFPVILNERRDVINSKLLGNYFFILVKDIYNRCGLNIIIKIKMCFTVWIPAVNPGKFVFFNIFAPLFLIANSTYSKYLNTLVPGFLIILLQLWGCFLAMSTIRFPEI